MFLKKKSDYSDDRLSLAQEIAETLKAKGHWVPVEWWGPHLITAVGMAVENKKPASQANLSERMECQDCKQTDPPAGRCPECGFVVCGLCEPYHTLKHLNEESPK